MTSLELLKNKKLTGRLSNDQTLEIYNEIKKNRAKYIEYLNLSSEAKQRMDKDKFIEIQDELNFLAKTSKLLLQSEISSHLKYGEILKLISSKQQEALTVFSNNPETMFVHNEPLAKYVITNPLNVNNFKTDAKTIFLILKEWFPSENEGDLFVLYLSIRHSFEDRDQIVRTYTYLEFKKP